MNMNNEEGRVWYILGRREKRTFLRKHTVGPRPKYGKIQNGFRVCGIVPLELEKKEERKSLVVWKALSPPLRNFIFIGSAEHRSTDEQRNDNVAVLLSSRRRKTN